MGMKEDADAIRAGVGLEAIAELLAEFPPSEQTGKREPEQIIWNALFVRKKPPTDPKKLRAKLAAGLKAQQRTLAERCLRYDEIRTQGLEAISDYDLTIQGFPGDTATERAVKALRCALWLADSHVTYSRSLIESLEEKLASLDAELESTKKAAKVSKAATEIPTGYEIVDVMLPAHQAFIVRKWAEAAQAKINSKRKK
ncbi:hypothetical protein [Azotobacter beijerinckii]|uniref:hypothetical protein n=1 Tax=Azotobacter beijerinckii TaxID=170623 RepID=UPI0029531B1D|nr:hypothetical protein [Azotobacter beijerinckii]MDV7210068.1 hypothetical protein [Azotobacter beijerinckii]